jgi:hypothetical protein
MGVLDYLLNVLGLGFWLAWRGRGLAPARPAGTLVGNLKPAAVRRGRAPAPGLGLAAVFLGRPVLHWLIADWTAVSPGWSAGPFHLVFRPDNWALLFAHSALSLIWSILVFQAAALLAAAVCRRLSEPRGLAELTRSIAGWAARPPVVVGLLIPSVSGALLWAAIALPLSRVGVVPKLGGPALLTAQALVAGVSVWLPVRWFVVGTLLLHAFQNYVYIGENQFFTAVKALGRAFEWPWSRLPFRLGRMDVTALFAAIVAWGVGECARRALAVLANGLWR